MHPGLIIFEITAKFVSNNNQLFFIGLKSLIIAIGNSYLFYIRISWFARESRLIWKIWYQNVRINLIIRSIINLRS